VPDSNPQMQRITKNLLSHILKWNACTEDWQRDVILIKSQTINAFCMPASKIAGFTGIIEQPQLSDLVFGHEIAHALREHARARAAKSAPHQHFPGGDWFLDG
jgi:Zn-dependent protease with chaperone function